MVLLSGCGAPDQPTISWYLAVQRGDIAQIERHIHWQTDINTPLPSGGLALHDAAEKGRMILLELLLENAPELDAKNADGLTAFDLAVLNGRTQAAELLLEAGAAYDPSQQLLLAAKTGVEDRDVVRFLKAHGADLDIQDEQGNSALMIATAANNHRLATHLLEQGAGVNLKNQAGLTALGIAQKSGANEIAHQLQRNGATLD